MHNYKKSISQAKSKSKEIASVRASTKRSNVDKMEDVGMEMNEPLTVEKI